MAQVRWAFDFKKWMPTKDEWTWANRCIQDEERQRIARFVFQKDAKASMVGRLLMRKFASKFTNLDYSVLRFDRTDKGKPFLIQPEDNGDPLSFNVSHNGDFCVLASNGRVPVGVDVMKTEYSGGKSVEEFFRLMDRQFAPGEWATIRAPTATSDRLSLFFRHWCLKESYVKAIGIGIGFDLRRIAFRLGPDILTVGQVTTSTVLMVDGHPDAMWRFEESQLDDTHLVATAIQVNGNVPSPTPVFEHLTIQEIFYGSFAWNPPEDKLWEDFKIKPETPF